MIPSGYCVRRGLSAVLATAFSTCAAASIRADENMSVNHDDSEPVSRSNMPGEWSGIAPDNNVLVTLRVREAPRRTVLSISEYVGEDVVTKVYVTTGPRVENGRFSMGSAHSEIQLEGKAKRAFGSGWGDGWLTLRDGSAAVRRMRVFFFHLRDSSWLRRTLELRFETPLARPEE